MGLLGVSSFSWQGYFWKIFKMTDAIAAPNATLTPAEQNILDSYNAAAQVVGTIETVLWILIGVVGLAAIVYSIYLGFQLARASEQGKRDEAKKHLITVIIAIVVTLVLVIFFLYLLPGIMGAFQGVKI